MNDLFDRSLGFLIVVCAADRTRARAFADRDRRQSLDEFKRLEHAGVMFRCGKKHAVRMLDGVQHDGYPA